MSGIIEDECASLNKTSGKFDCVINSKCAISNKLYHKGKAVLCGIDDDTKANKICCPKKVRQVRGLMGDISQKRAVAIVQQSKYLYQYKIR